MISRDITRHCARDIVHATSRDAVQHHSPRGHGHATWTWLCHADMVIPQGASGTSPAEPRHRLCWTAARACCSTCLLQPVPAAAISLQLGPQAHGGLLCSSLHRSAHCCIVSATAV
mmetsp:Transcript_70009/g.155996  ORF Transcript_70009/g.155996 Transcript_70009/m.155996 type:complete len:116 (-) Transcript_70009:1141-1488(-)